MKMRETDESSALEDEAVSLCGETILKQKAPRFRPPRVGDIYMTLLVALLVCVSATVFLAHAVDAYGAG